MSDTFEERWEKSSILVIGADYSDADLSRWSRTDPYYIGVGGTISIGGPFQQDWNNEIFWEPKDLKLRTFQRIYIDRCVWNILSASLVLFQRMLEFAERYLSNGGKLMIHIDAWNNAMSSYMISQFTKKSLYNRRPVDGYTKTDSEALEAIIDTRRFIPALECMKGWQPLYLYHL
jgi:hypothetical protein